MYTIFILIFFWSLYDNVMMRPSKKVDRFKRKNRENNEALIG